VFEHVAAELAMEPGKIVFLDDNEMNVVEAAAVGYTAVRVRGVEEARAALAELGLAVD
jgi:FMN phosphatase YigB (HAD superfamily)